MDEAEGLLGELQEALAEWARTSHAPISHYCDEHVIHFLARNVVLMLQLYDSTLSYIYQQFVDSDDIIF